MTTFHAVAPNEVKIERQAHHVIFSRWRWEVNTHVTDIVLARRTSRKLVGYGFSLSERGAHRKAKRFIAQNPGYQPSNY